MDAADWDTRYTTESLVWGTDPNRWVVSELGVLNPGSVLDLGCGEGRNAIWLAAEGWRVTAIDFSAVAVDRARDLAKETAERLQRDLDITWRVAHDTTNLTEGYGGPQDPEVLYSAADVEEDLQDYLSSGALVLERSGRVARAITDEDGVTHYAWDLLVHGKGRDMHKGEVTFG